MLRGGGSEALDIVREAAKVVKDDRTIRRKVDKFETEIVVLVDSSSEYESIVGWDCYPNNEKSIQPYPSPEFLNSLSFIKKFYPAPRWGEGKFPKDSHEIVAISRHSEAHSQSAEWLQKTRRSAGLFCNYLACLTRMRILQAKESSFLQYKAVAKNENNSTETDQASMPLGIFASKSVSCRISKSDLHKKAAFTLAEVLITLGIIGVVAALTLPSVINKVQNIVLKNQFKKAYSNLQNAINLVQKDEPIACWYWDHNPYPLAECISWNEYGTCIGWSTLPPDYSGMTQDCNTFYENLRKALNTIKYCENNALKNGCITDAYRGIDKVEADKNPDVKQDPDQIFSDNNIKTKYRVFITSDNVLYMHWDQQWPWFAFDINGHKGPNKWGHDIFTFSIVGNKIDGITKIDPTTYPVDKGGKTMSEMINLP